MVSLKVFITGCSHGGIGDELAQQLHAQGHTVIASARDVHSMESLDKLGLTTLPLDVTNEASIHEAKTRVSELTDGKLDILINNAGVSYPFSAADMDLNTVKAVFDVNVFGAMAVAKEFIPLLIASGDARIVQLGSLAGVMPVPFGAAYNASKAALHSFGDTLRVELAPFNIKVITIVAGNAKSNLSKPWHRLPADSIYQPIQAEYQDRRIDHFQDGAIPREVVCRDIVKEILKRRPRAWLWTGKNAWTCWIISTFFGRRGFDALMSNIFGLAKLSKLVAAEKKRV